MPYFFFSFRYYDLNLGTKIGSSLLPNVGMAFGCVLIALQEANGKSASARRRHDVGMAFGCVLIALQEANGKSASS